MMVEIVVLVTAKSPLIRWLAVAAMGLNLSIAAGTFVYLYRRRQRLANHA